MTCSDGQLPRRDGAIPEPFIRGVLSGLLTALRIRDAETIAHCRRVATYSLLLAESIGFDSTRRDELAVGALLHDIGKIGLADAVLRKPGPLSGDELRHVQTHPVVGYEMVRHTLAPYPLALGVIRSHHERFDGRGYPDGLGGEDIPLAARMFSVVDAFDAMTSDRPYAPARSVEGALAELHRYRGSQFCPECLDAFLSLERSVLDGVRSGSVDRVNLYLGGLSLPMTDGRPDGPGEGSVFPGV